MTNYLVTVPLYRFRSEEVGEVLIESVVNKYGTPEYIMMNQDSVFKSSLMSYLFKRLGIKIQTVGLYNHKSLQAEHGIKPLSNILIKHLTGTRTNMAQILVINHICLQYISFTKLRELFSI